jgi:hypothetical protein
MSFETSDHYLFENLTHKRQIWYCTIVLKYLFVQTRFFLKRGLTIACLTDCGTVDSLSEALTMSVIKGRTPSIDCFKRKVGIGSNSHDVDADFITIFLTSSIEAGDRTVKASPFHLTSARRKSHLSLQNRVEELRSFRIVWFYWWKMCWICLKDQDYSHAFAEQLHSFYPLDCSWVSVTVFDRFLVQKVYLKSNLVTTEHVSL